MGIVQISAFSVISVNNIRFPATTGWTSILVPKVSWRAGGLTLKSEEIATRQRFWLSPEIAWNVIPSEVHAAGTAKMNFWVLMMLDAAVGVGVLPSIATKNHSKTGGLFGPPLLR